MERNYSLMIFQLVIGKLKAASLLTHDVQLVLLGRIGHAVECGEITGNEARALLNEIGNGFLERNVRALQLASMGPVDETE